MPRKAKTTTETTTVATVEPTVAPKKHDIAGRYTGSPTFRHHEKKLTALRRDYVAKSTSPRDHDFIADLQATYGSSPFKRFDCDAGNCGRAYTLGLLAYNSSDDMLSSPDFELQLTDRGAQLGANINKKQ